MFGIPQEALTEVLVEWGPPGLVIILLLGVWILTIRYLVKSHRSEREGQRDAHREEREMLRKDIDKLTQCLIKRAERTDNEPDQVD